MSLNLPEQIGNRILLNNQLQGSSHGVMAKVLDCGIEISEFDLQSCCYAHFLINTLGEKV